MAKLSDLYVRISARTAELGRKLSGVRAVLGRFNAFAIRWAKRIGIAIGAALIVGIAASIKLFAAFEARMRNINTIAKQTENQLKKTSEQVLRLATVIGKVPTDLADALYDINSAGFQAARGLEVLEAAAKAGRAGLADTRTAARGITAVLNAYGLSADQAGDVSDILFKTVEKGVITFGELSDGLGATVATGAAAGVSFDKLAAAVATMTKGGIRSDVAFTSLNRLLTAFLKPSTKLAAALKKQGFESGLALIKTKGLGGAIQFLAKASGGSADELAQMGLDMRALRAGLSLTRNAGQDFARDLEEIAVKGNRAGATQAALTEQGKSLAFQWDRVKAKLAVFATLIGERLAPFLDRMLDQIENLGTDFDSLQAAADAIVDTFVQWAMAIRAVAKAIDDFPLVRLYKVVNAKLWKAFPLGTQTPAAPAGLKMLGQFARLRPQIAGRSAGGGAGAAEAAEGRVREREGKAEAQREKMIDILDQRLGRTP